jgi:UDP-N-acetylmuramoyl-tripeptide--D-alanyl-D-alanine ligase
MSSLNLENLFTCFNQTCPKDLANLPFPNFSIDTRAIQPGTHTVFVAIKGAQTDGHEYIAQAAEAGAIGAIVSSTYAYGQDFVSKLPESFFLISVDNTEKALIKLAKWYRAQFTLPVVGITGSCGKTTVKEMISQILERVGPTLKTKGNYNNEIGLPLTILSLKPHHQFAVIEMGARHIGDIRVLSDIAQPTLSVVTLIAPAHIEIFKSIENIAKTKGEIYHGLPKTGFAIVNRDEPYSDYFIHSCINAKLVTFSLASGTDYFATDIQLAPMNSAFILHTPFGHIQVKLPIPGMHNISNALAAASLAGSLGVKLEVIQAGLEHFSTITGRMQIKTHASGAVIIDDTYNANPRSLTAAMEVLANYPGKKCLVLGDMGELGDEAAKMHFEMGEKAKALGIEYLFTVGKLSEQATKAFGVGALHFNSQASVIDAVNKILDKNCTVLVKGSRSAGMEKIANSLMTAKGQTQCLIG